MSVQRQVLLSRVRADGAFDVLVVGGGINGLGVYRELALQGLRVLLVERNDFCSGCSAAPSRMIHGGLRYLENGEFDLVRESLAERDALLRNAPHLVRPLPTTIPISSRFSGLFNAAKTFLGGKGKPSARGALPIRIGLTLYDLVTRERRLLPTHTFRSARATFARWPALLPSLKYSATYYDAWISHPERLGLELVLDTAAVSAGSIALNYAELSASGDGFLVTDHETGEVLGVKARAVVNATGAWLDRAVSQLAAPDPRRKPLVGGTKGSHLILGNAALREALGGHMIYFENSDGRVCIVFPYLGNVLAGSTDLRVDKPERTRCEPEERDYILGSLARIFPGIPLSPEDILFSYSGIRPLPVSDQDFTGRISRGHFTHRIAGAAGVPPQFCMVGGKWTTFRAFAEQTADQVLAELGHRRRRDTRDLAIGGGAGCPLQEGRLAGSLLAECNLEAARAAHLAGTYGTRAKDFLRFAAGRSDDTPLADGVALTAAEIVWLLQGEHVLHLSDLVLRRTALAITGTISGALIEAIGAIMARERGWPPARTTRECEALRQELATYHGVSAETLDQRSLRRTKECV
ncbi:glycerol-3-phosphate dehydrogenase/oxidase [Pannonibacter tanglangensis]|uniref:FAD-dependent oxidoreductase n=1 Tax=Pannonibacter tanglangensis TaxID=2750084 RepID=A0ABW9ZES8_9HYPH|nr:glycerol-3-phosphate dehydrogenase/oxidase [Pannonibacter sp. XCT-34]NBN63206.1 FAD-dependent oxidoreductase [Pannonibacter sp. XCT-34]